MNVNDTHHSRRALLQVAGAGAVGLAGSTAGCLGLSNGGGGSDTLDTWLPAPSALGEDRYDFTRLDYGAVVAEDGPFDEQTRERVMEPVALGARVVQRADVDQVVSIGSSKVFGRIVVGSFDPEVVAQRVIETTDQFEIKADGTYRGHDMYAPPSKYPLSVAVGTDSVIAMASGTETGARSGVEALLDAEAGAVDRYGEVDDNVATLLNVLDGSLYSGRATGIYPVLPAVFPREDALVASGLDADLDGDAVAFDRLYVFEDADAAENADLTEWRDTLVELLDVLSLDLDRSGRTVTVSGSVPTTMAYLGGSRSLSLSVFNLSIPQAQFGFEYRAENGTVRIAHAGGGTFTAENTGGLQIEVGGETAAVWFDGRGESERVSAGSQVRVEASPGATVEVVWVSPETTTDVTVRSFTVPE